MKNTKIMALLGATALLTIGAAFTSLAASYNWYQVNGVWHCKDRSGDEITQDWAKSGNDMYYLDENGEMASDYFLEDNDNYYYLDETGRMTKNRWVKVENPEDNDEDEFSWYYFQSSGKAMKGKSTLKPTAVNGQKYIFGEDGKMQYGWVGGTADNNDEYAWKDAVYYCGDAEDGAVRTGWAKIDVIDDSDEVDSENQSYWFYFGTNGQKTAATGNATLVEKSINGKRYAFDNHGVMKAEWVQTNASGSAANVGSYAYFQNPEQGAMMKKGWFRVLPKDKVNGKDNEDEVAHWYYAKGDGTLCQNEFKTINGKKYAFNDKGEMVAGLYFFDVNDIAGTINSETACIDTENEIEDVMKGEAPYTSDNGALYFFGDEATDGSMKLGLQKITVDGENYSVNLKSSGSSKGQGINGISGSAYYINGFKLCADEELKYQAFEAEWNDGVTVPSKATDINTISPTATRHNSMSSDKNYVLISSSGAIVKNASSKKDADDYKYSVKNYKATAQ